MDMTKVKSMIGPPGGTATLAGHTVARVGFGVMQLAVRQVGKDTAVSVLRSAVSQGVNHLDTAQFYGECNDQIRAALHPYPEDLVLVSKVGAERGGDGALVPAQRPQQLRASVEANLASLGTGHLHVVNLRRLDSPPSMRADPGQLVDLDSQLAEMIALRDEGKIGAIGLSGVSAATLERAHQGLASSGGVACVQNSYSVLDRASEPALEVCRGHGIAWVPFFPLGSAGFPGVTSVTGHPAVIAAAQAAGATAAQAGLAWLLAGYEQTLLIPGTANPDHLAENIAAGSVRLDADTVAGLGRLADPR
jgi:pyridoxine 4-dehydrogenase